mgnify:FL=1
MVDLNKDTELNKKITKITVIGQIMAGKTSLVKPMQQNKRISNILSSDSDSSSKLDDATKIFKTCEASVSSGSKLVFHNFGGPAIHHFAYQLSSRSQYVPLLVINIAEFDRLATDYGEHEACEKLCFGWLSHLYLSCPKAGPPQVVLTHSDRIENDILQMRKDQLITATEDC